MGADVGARRPGGPDTTDVDAGAGVRGVPWTRNAVLVDWMLGNGAQIVPAYSPALTLADTKTHEFYFRATPRYQAFQRIWSFTLRTTATGSVTCGVAAPTGSTETSYGVAETQETSPVLTFVEDLSSQSDAEGNVSIQFTPSGGDVILESLACVEVPRATLTTTTDEDGVDTTKFGTSFPIRAEDHTNMVDVLNDETKIGRRCSLWQWAVPSNVNSALTAGFAWSTASSSYQSMFPFGVPILTRKIAPADTTGDVKCKVLAWVNTSSISASVYFTSSVNGNSNSASITATIPTWSPEFTLTVDCDDVDSTDGRQTAASPAWDYAGVYGKTNPGAFGGSRSINISAVSIWEEPPGWTPIQLSDLGLWLRADLGVSTSGSNVTAWADQSGNGNDAAPGTSPTLNSSNSALNNQASIDFNGSTQYLIVNDSSTIRLTGSGYEVHVVGTFANNATNDDFLAKTDAAISWLMRCTSADQFRCLIRNAADTAYYDATDTAPTLGDDTSRLAIMRYDGSGTMTVSVDNSTAATDTDTGHKTETENLGIGARASGAQFAACSIAEIVIVQSELSTADRNQLISYFESRYGAF